MSSFETRAQRVRWSARVALGLAVSTVACGDDKGPAGGVVAIDVVSDAATTDVAAEVSSGLVTATFDIRGADDVLLPGVQVRFVDARGTITELTLDAASRATLTDFMPPLSATYGTLLATRSIVAGFYRFSVADLERHHGSDGSVFVSLASTASAAPATETTSCSAWLTEPYVTTVYVNTHDDTPGAVLMNARALQPGSEPSKTTGSISVPVDGPIHVVGTASLEGHIADAPRIYAWAAANAETLDDELALDFDFESVPVAQATLSLRPPPFADRDNFWMLGWVVAEWDGHLLVGRSDGLTRGDTWDFAYQWITPGPSVTPRRTELLFLGDVVSSFISIEGEPRETQVFDLAAPVEIVSPPTTTAGLASGVDFDIGPDVDPELEVLVDGVLAARIIGGRGITHFDFLPRPTGRPMVDPLAPSATIAIDTTETGAQGGIAFTRTAHGWPATISR